MKRIIAVSILFVSLVSCKFAAKEVKKVSKIRKAVKDVCDCRNVDVESDYDPNGANLTITIGDFEGDNLAEMSDSIMTNVKDAFPNLCNHEEVYLIYEGDEFDIEYVYNGCNLNPDVDTTFWDFDEFEEFEEFEEESTTDENVKDIENMIQELEDLKEKMEEESNE